MGICLIPEGNCQGAVERQPGIPAWSQLSMDRGRNAAGRAGTADTLGKGQGPAMERFLGASSGEAPPREQRKDTCDSCDGRGAAACGPPPGQCMRPLAGRSSRVMAAFLRVFPGITPGDSRRSRAAGCPSGRPPGGSRRPREAREAAPLRAPVRPLRCSPWTPAQRGPAGPAGCRPYTHTTANYTDSLRLISPVTLQRYPCAPTRFSCFSRC